MAKPLAKATVKSKYAGMNTLEARYAAYLDVGLREGRVLQWDFEAIKLRLADGAWYTPDFRVILPDGTEEYHETKGFWREAARVRLKVAAELHPYKFVAIKWVNKQWEREEF